MLPTLIVIKIYCFVKTMILFSLTSNLKKHHRKFISHYAHLPREGYGIKQDGVSDLKVQ